MAKLSDETKTKRSFIIIPTVNRTLETMEKVNRKNNIENMISFRFFRFLISQKVNTISPKRIAKTVGSESFLYGIWLK